MQRWWIGNSAEKARGSERDQAQNYSKRNGDKKEADNLWKFRVFVNFDLNSHGMA